VAAFDLDDFLARYRDRCQAAKDRPLPPVAGEERALFLAQVKHDIADFALIGQAEVAVDDGVIELRSALGSGDVPAQVDLTALRQRFAERASSVKRRTPPPVAGPERTRFVQQAQTDFMDFAIVADAAPEAGAGVVVLRIDLRPGR
jgi:hypothetical protein